VAEQWRLGALKYGKPDKKAEGKAKKPAAAKTPEQAWPLPAKASKS